MQGWKCYRSVVVLILLAAATMPVQAAPALQTKEPIAPTYTIFATREGLVGHRTANGHIIQPRDHFVALPSWDVLAPKGSNKYQVRLTYQGRSTIAPVWDVGPWNTNDDYWSPSRRYSDLPVGLPMAQAAYYQGYNGGRDVFGRRIGLPNGIDIADGTFWDDLGMRDSDWVQVTFLWLGRDPGPDGTVEAPVTTISNTSPTIDIPALEDGAIAIDAGESGYTANQATWFTDGCGMGGNHVWTYSTTDQAKSENRSVWQPDLSVGFYEVKAYIPACGRVAATNSARYRITHDGAVTEVTLDQAKAAGTWTSLGVYHFGGQGSPQVELNDMAGDKMRAVRFDAIAWIPRSDTTAPSTNITTISQHNNGYLVRWEGNDDISGVAAYDVQVRQLPNGGWRDWLMNTALNEAWFGPDEGKHFAFRARARDWASNQEAWLDQQALDTTSAQQ
jgi:hypothetical protein